MIFSADSALNWVEKIIAIAVILQTIELLQIRNTFSAHGIWRWSILRDDFQVFPRPISWLLEQMLSDPNFLIILAARLSGAVLLLFFSHPAILLVLLISTALVSLRWRGTFNGGSDFMTLIVLMALTIATFFHDDLRVAQGCLWYIALQSCTSYFIAGTAKLKRRDWRTGRALSGFLNSPIYTPPKSLEIISRNTFLAVASSWMLIVFECGFPITLLNSKACITVLILAVIFHLANFYVFGLNRFLLAWAATYPALFWCSQQIGLNISY